MVLTVLFEFCVYVIEDSRAVVDKGHLSIGVCSKSGIEEDLKFRGRPWSRYSLLVIVIRALICVIII